MFSLIIITIKVGIILWMGTMIFVQLINPIDARWIQRKPMGIMIGFYTIAMFGHNVWLVYAMMVAAVPLLAKSRSEAAGLFVVALGSLPDLASMVHLGSVNILFIDKWICVSLGFAWLLVIKPSVGVRAGARLDGPFLIMLALELAQGRDVNFTSTLRSILSTTLAIGLPYFTLVNSISRVEDLRRVMVALVYVGFQLAFLGLVEAFSHVLIYPQLYGPLHVAGIMYSQLYKIRGGILRPVTVFPDATSFAQFLIIILMATIACRQSFRSTSKFMMALSLIALGIFVTSTRNAWIGAIICILAFDLFRKRFVALTGKLSVLGMGYAILLLLAEFVPYVKTMMGKSDDTAGTTDYRSRLLTRGIEEFHNHPLTGVNGAQLTVNMKDMIQGEGIIDFVNGYLFYALTVGTAGLVGLALVFLMPCWGMLKTRRAMMAQGPFLQRTAAFVFAVGLSYFVTTAFTGFGGRGSMFLYLTIGIGAVLYAWRRISPELLASTDRQRAVPIVPDPAAAEAEA
jgi:O-antigen ligase